MLRDQEKETAGETVMMLFQEREKKKTTDGEELNYPNLFRRLENPKNPKSHFFYVTTQKDPLFQTFFSEFKREWNSSLLANTQNFSYVSFYQRHKRFRWSRKQ